MRLAPGREVIPIGTVSPNSVLRLGLLDELGSPVCDFRQWAEFGVRGSVGKDEVGGHQERRLNLDTLPLSRVRTLLSSGNCHCGTYDVLNVLSSFGWRCRGRPHRLPNSNCQRRYTIRDAEADSPIEASARTNRANARHQRHKSARRCLPTAEPCCLQPVIETGPETGALGVIS